MQNEEYKAAILHVLVTLAENVAVHTTDKTFSTGLSIPFGGNGKSATKKVSGRKVVCKGPAKKNKKLKTASITSNNRVVNVNKIVNLKKTKIIKKKKSKSRNNNVINANGNMTMVNNFIPPQLLPGSSGIMPPDIVPNITIHNNSNKTLSLNNVSLSTMSQNVQPNNNGIFVMNNMYNVDNGTTRKETVAAMKIVNGNNALEQSALTNLASMISDMEPKQKAAAYTNWIFNNEGDMESSVIRVASKKLDGLDNPIFANNSAFPAPIPPIGNKKKRKNNLKIRKTNSGDDTSKPKFFDDLPSPATLSTIPPKKKYKYMNQKL